MGGRDGLSPLIPKADWGEVQFEATVTLVSDVATGQVGAIYSLESSRLGRSNKDWHRLLELCAVTKTLLFDCTLDKARP